MSNLSFVSISPIYCSHLLVARVTHVSFSNFYSPSAVSLFLSAVSRQLSTFYQPVISLRLQKFSVSKFLQPAIFSRPQFRRQQLLQSAIFRVCISGGVEVVAAVGTDAGVLQPLRCARGVEHMATRQPRHGHFLQWRLQDGRVTHDATARQGRLYFLPWYHWQSVVSTGGRAHDATMCQGHFYILS